MVSKTSTGLSSDVDEARGQILAAAERVIQRKGLSKTTMDDIGNPGHRRMLKTFVLPGFLPAAELKV